MTSSSRKTGIALVTSLGLLAALAVAGSAAAHENPNHGTIKVHDDATANPPQRNQPHVSCEFWIEGFDMSEGAGHLDFYSIPPTTNPRELVLTSPWTADSGSNEEGYHFLAGPFTLEPGHYRVEAYVGGGHPGNHEHFAKTKTFWVNECPEEPRDVPCPPNLAAIPQSDGDIFIDWDAVADADEYRVYRAVGDDDFSSYAVVAAPDTSFLDTDTVVGETYHYMVTAVVDGQESEDCEPVSATAIPFFPSAVAGIVAAAGAAVAYVGLRRRA